MNRNLLNPLALMLTVTAFAQIQAENYVVELDWNRKETVEESIVQQCDDTYYSAIQIKIPGRAGKDFDIYTDASINSGVAKPGCTVKKITGNTSTTFLFDASALGGCTIKVYKARNFGNNVTKYTIATYDISDAC